MARFKLATWNINSVRLRLPLLKRLIKAERPDVICLQEIKVETAGFPLKDLKRLGFVHAAVHGQKGYHGVAILSRLPLEAIRSDGFAGVADARHVAAMLPGGIELHNFYVPAGGDEPDPQANPKFAHKLRFLDELGPYFGRRPDRRTAAVIMVGDLNVAPHENDVWSHRQLLDVVSHTPAETQRLAAAREAFDWTDVTRAHVPLDQKVYSWWSYRNRDWRASDRGRRLDHIWVSPALRGATSEHRILKDARDWPGPSDHVPVLTTVEL